ncbi:phosphodiesterase [Flexivirga caeni]|uniref:Phosphodiesterase n=1 Tax=Flexivirga caeni TaxID=2294115 RepID=A0A3M9M3E8_9MICO|nr:phosphodiesterase [Flexivirga caeni]
MRRKVCLIGIDGLRLDIALEEGVAPVLSSMMQHSAVASMQMEVPTISGPGWSSLLTGASHDEHGVRDNSFVGQRLAHHPDFLSRAFYADQKTTTFAAAGWPPLVDPAGVGPVIHARAEQQRAGLHGLVVRDGETYGYRRADGEVADVAVAVLREHAPDASFVYFCQADEAGHLFGAQTPEYRSAITCVDAQLGRVLEAITDRDADGSERWLVVVTTDHGHLDRGGHGGGEPEVRRSFVAAQVIGADAAILPETIHPTELTPLMLAYLAGEWG